MRLLVKKVHVPQTNGETKTYNNYYLELENGYQVAIKPSFPKDHKTLSAVAIKKE